MRIFIEGYHNSGEYSHCDKDDDGRDTDRDGDRSSDNDDSDNGHDESPGYTCSEA